MKNPICNTCGMPAVGNYIEITTEKLDGSVMCENCLMPQEKPQQISFEEWWKEYENYNRVLRQAVKKRNKKLDKIVIE